MEKNYSEDKKLLYKVSDLYYNGKMTQEEISNKLCISRPTISRILKRSKAAGIVQIKVVNPFTNNYNEIENQLEREMGLTEVVIVDTYENEQMQIDALGKAGAEYLERVLKDGDYVGVSMGRTLNAVAKFSRKQSNFCDIKFFPLVGGVGQMRTDIHCNQIVLELNKAYGGEYYLLHAPAYIGDKELRENLKNYVHIKQIFELMDKMNVAVLGIGALVENSTVKQTGYYTDETIQKMKEEGLVGDICVQVFDTNGRTNHEFNENIFGYRIENLRKVDKRIGVSGGFEKVDVLHGAISGGFINILITDYATAKSILKKHRNSKGDNKL